MSYNEAALTRLLDEAAIRAVIARFADVATRGDYAAFRRLWSDDAEWVIGEPFEMHAKGIGDVVSLYRGLREERDYFVQFVAPPSSIEINGDDAEARCMCYEAAHGGTGEYCYYRNTGMWSDRLRRLDHGWVFTSRTYRYLWLDKSPFNGDIFQG